MTPLEPTWRKPAGMVIILLLIALWAWAVVSASVVLEGLPWPIHAVYYLVAGIVWIAPLKPLLRWMETGKWR